MRHGRRRGIQTRTCWRVKFLRTLAQMAVDVLADPFEAALMIQKTMAAFAASAAVPVSAITAYESTI